MAHGPEETRALRFSCIVLAGEAPVATGPQDPAVPGSDRLRAGHADREQVVEMLKDAFGEGVVGHYLHTAEWEQFEYDRRITDWELKRGFERS